MINYPYIRLLITYLNSKKKERISIYDQSILRFRAGLFDIDPYLEINNGRYHTLGDIGRFNHGFLTGFYKKSRENNLIFTVAGATAKYRHRIPFGMKFEMRTKIVFTDDKWVYYLTDFHSENRLRSSILARTGTVKNGKLLSTKEASKYFDLNIPSYDIPDWISLWIKSDEKFPGFQK